MFDPSNMAYFNCRHSKFDNTICIDIHPSETNRELYEYDLKPITIKDSSNCILLFKLIVYPTVNGSIRTHSFCLILQEYRIIDVVTYTLMPYTKPPFTINNQQVVIFVMLRRYHLYPTYICMENKSIYEGYLS